MVGIILYDMHTPVGRNDLEARITVMEAHLRYLLGNGQPGKVKEIERMLVDHDKRIQAQKDATNKILWIGIGALAILQVLQANGLLNLSKIFGH